MNAPVKVGIYAVVLALVLGAGFVVGAAVGPLGDDVARRGTTLDDLERYPAHGEPARGH